MYFPLSSTRVLQHIASFTAADRPLPSDAINNIYKLPSIERLVHYLHGDAGFPTKETWLQVIRKGGYLTCPLTTVKNVNKHFPESDDIQKFHICNLLLGVRFTQNNPPLAPSPTPLSIPILPTKDVFVTVYNPRKTIFTDQTGKFPLRSSRGNQYQMIVHDIDSASSWIKPMKNRTEVEIVLARLQALARMKLQGIVPNTKCSTTNSRPPTSPKFVTHT